MNLTGQARWTLVSPMGSLWERSYWNHLPVDFTTTVLTIGVEASTRDPVETDAEHAAEQMTQFFRVPRKFNRPGVQLYFQAASKNVQVIEHPPYPNESHEF